MKRKYVIPVCKLRRIALRRGSLCVASIIPKKEDNFSDFGEQNIDSSGWTFDD